MFRKKIFLSILLSLCLLCGCTNDYSENSSSINTAISTTKQNKTGSIETDEQKDEDKYIEVNGKKLTVDEIITQIPTTINNMLYYSGNYSESNNMFFNKDLILNKQLNYKLYGYYPISSPNSNLDIHLPEVRLVFTDMEHPLSTEDNPKLYYITIKVTENGLQSTFFSGYHISKTETPGIFLGSYSLCIDEIVAPKHEVMSEEWKTNVEKALRLYMDENDFWAYAEDNLEIGNYKVYIKGFSANDTDTNIIFEHENGNVYEGFYYFVHHVSGERSADLNKVALIEWDNDEGFQAYLERVKQNATFSMEYEVYQ